MQVRTHVQASGLKSQFHSFTSWLNKQVMIPVCDEKGCRLVKRPVASGTQSS